jgi:hypothetical protein
MTVKRCSHKISINLDFLKQIFIVPKDSALHYSTIMTSVEIRNDMTKEDLKTLANWILVSGVLKDVKVGKDITAENELKEKETEKEP